MFFYKNGDLSNSRSTQRPEPAIKISYHGERGDRPALFDLPGSGAGPHSMN